MANCDGDKPFPKLEDALIHLEVEASYAPLSTLGKCIRVVTEHGRMARMKIELEHNLFIAETKKTDEATRKWQNAERLIECLNFDKRQLESMLGSARKHLYQEAASKLREQADQIIAPTHMAAGLRGAADVLDCMANDIPNHSNPSDKKIPGGSVGGRIEDVI